METSGSITDFNNIEKAELNEKPPFLCGGKT
jgi:hypothetical protein